MRRTGGQQRDGAREASEPVEFDVMSSCAQLPSVKWEVKGARTHMAPPNTANSSIGYSL
eukprot:CAMPEP_0197582128 /NCGR_PEP_ID=MMETSP1326-20131121/5434_1 /TAXON_ID=1155430 /ORGANISM="Genus nov. species nov., Strain RCC2288" /LENGTH=58 /DNA_ID=CAMNT_0043146153 /DNA_START=46 /DNA_END=219 /DNA_ORIENTATION=-